MLENSETLNNQAVQLAFKGQYVEAIACFKRAITVENKNYLLWYNLALTYRDCGKFHLALETMEHAFRLNPQHEELTESLATLCIQMNRFDEAMSWCAHGINLNESNPHFWNVGGVIQFNLGNYKEAAYFFESAVMLNPMYYDAVFNLRDTYDELGNRIGVEECEKKLRQIKRNEI